MVSNDINYWSAGHSIDRSFGPLLLSESFNTAPPPNDETMNHSLSVKLNTLIYGNLISSINYQNRRLTRTWSASTGVQSEKNSYPGFSLEGTVNYLEKTEKVLDWMPNYAETWLRSWTALFPDNGSSSNDTNMLNRDMRLRAGFYLDRLPVGAELSFEGNSSVSIPFEFTRSLSTARIDIPFSFSTIRGRIRTQRDISRSLSFSGDTVGEDFFYYGESLSDASSLWSRIPIYALFDPKLDSAMDHTLSKNNIRLENIYFHEMFAYNLFFPERYDLLSLIVPVSHFTQLDRTMEQRMDTRLDVLTVSSGFGFSSINLFGAMGSRPLFKFYRNDEFRHSITGIISFPRNEDALWRIQAEQNLSIYGFSGAELGILNTFTFIGNGRTGWTEENRTGWIGGRRTGWMESLILLWTIPREKTLLSSIFSAGINKISESRNFPIMSELALSEHERFIRESLEIILDNSSEYGIYSFILGHESVVRIIGKLTLTGFAKLGIQRDARTEETSLLMSFGTTLTVTF